MKLRFAVADDAAFLREIIKNILTAEGHQFVGSADNGDEAILLVDRTLPDVIVLDVVMPIKNGFQAAQVIKEFHPQVKIIGCSTLEDTASMQKAKEHGFDYYIKKPFSKDDLIKALNEVMMGEEFNNGRV